MKNKSHQIRKNSNEAKDSKDEASQKDEESKKGDQAFYCKWWFLLLVGGLFVASLVGAYFLLNGDDEDHQAYLDISVSSPTPSGSSRSSGSTPSSQGEFVPPESDIGHPNS